MSHKPKVAKLDGLAKLPHLTVAKGKKCKNKQKIDFATP